MTQAIWTREDVGCYAVGARGHQHIRNVLADLIDTHFIDLLDDVNAMFAGGLSDDACATYLHNIIASLRGKMSDDACEEDDAIDLLNREACTNDVHFELSDGDLVLVSDADRCPDCGAGEGHFQNCPANL